MLSLSPSKATKESNMSLTHNLCTVEDCARYVTGKGYCNMHLDRVRKGREHGGVEAMKNGKVKASLPQENRPEYNSFRSLRSRCNDKGYRYYHRYGGRGISICKDWTGRDGFKNFLREMGKKPTTAHSIDRIDNDGNYEPSNCKWATQKEQANNSTNIVMVDIGNGRQKLRDALEEYGVEPRTYYNRVHSQGWEIKRAIITPLVVRAIR